MLRHTIPCGHLSPAANVSSFDRCSAALLTYASLARNTVGLDKYTVHELLNHSDNEMRITDRYIERDWQRLYDTHRKVITLIDWSKICKGE